MMGRATSSSRRRNAARFLRSWLLLLFCVMPLLACAAPLLLTPSPTPTAIPLPTPIPTATPEPPDTGWQPLQPGIELRSLSVTAELGVERLTVVRIVPQQVAFRVHYTPGAAQPVSVWARQTQAAVVINAGYFTRELFTTGLLVSQGQRHGVSYGDFAGMFAVGEGAVSVRWLRERPYNPHEALQEAVQSFPVLVKPGGVMGFPADGDDGRLARRSVIAQDREGRSLLIGAPRGYLSLHALATWLAASDLDLDVALNLDGGTSTGLWVAGGPLWAQIDSFTLVPAVITVGP